MIIRLTVFAPLDTPESEILVHKCGNPIVYYESTNKVADVALQ